MDVIIFGGLVLDRYFEIKKYPIRGQDGFITGENEFVGGCAINMASTVNNLGGCAHIVSSVGNDDVGKSIISYIEKHGFSKRYIRTVNEPSGYCLVFIEPDGERTFLTKKGAEGSFEKSLVPDFDNIGAAAVTGYYLLNENSEQIMDCLEKLAKRHVKILFDPSPLAGSISAELMTRMLDISSVVTPNETELAFFSDKPEKWIENFTQRGGTVFLKKGQKGGIVYEKNGCFEYKAKKANAVDTTGAGDSFAGAVAYCMAQNLSMKKAAELALMCAAKTVEIKGPHGFWTIEE